jgi:hypothetical protein
MLLHDFINNLNLIIYLLLYVEGRKMDPGFFVKMWGLREGSEGPTVVSCTAYDLAGEQFQI